MESINIEGIFCDEYSELEHLSVVEQTLMSGIAWNRMPHAWTPLKKTPPAGSGGKPQSGGSNLPGYIPPEHTGKTRQQKGRGGIRHRGTSGGGKWEIELNNDDGSGHYNEYGLMDDEV